MTKQINSLNKAEMPSHKRGEISMLGGETRTWAPMGSVIGAIIGIVVGIGVTLAVWSSYTYPSEPSAEIPAMMYTSLFIAPLIGLLFGGLAGTLIGIGTPKFNPSPQQGRLRNRWNIFRNSDVTH